MVERLGYISESKGTFAKGFSFFIGTHKVKVTWRRLPVSQGCKHLFKALLRWDLTVAEIFRGIGKIEVIIRRS